MRRTVARAPAVVFLAAARLVVVAAGFFAALLRVAGLALVAAAGFFGALRLATAPLARVAPPNLAGGFELTGSAPGT